MAERAASGPNATAKAEAALGRLPAIGCWVGLPTVLSADIVASVGFDFAMIDLEHGPSSLETAVSQVIAVSARGAAPLIRVPESRGPWIKRALDIGAVGVMAPQIETPEEAAAAVRAFRYGPEGRRGNAASLVRAASYGADPAYAQNWNDAGLFIAQIESPEALALAGDIAAVDGVDALFFGPADFAAAAGFPGAAAVSQAFDRMTAAAKSAGKLAGSVLFGALDARALIARGVDLVAVAFDVDLLRRGAGQALADARGR